MFKRTLNRIRRKKLRYILTFVIIISCLYILYQLAMLNELTRGLHTPKENLICGTHSLQRSFYIPDKTGHFQCIHSSEKINFSRVNDDYCDCEDGSDEPGTNACANGQFFCTNQDVYNNYPRVLPSSRVNDGICDCCDGSDEWNRRILSLKVPFSTQRLFERFQSPCPKLCPD